MRPLTGRQFVDRFAVGCQQVKVSLAKVHGLRKLACCPAGSTLGVQSRMEPGHALSSTFPRPAGRRHSCGRHRDDVDCRRRDAHRRTHPSRLCSRAAQRAPEHGLLFADLWDHGRIYRLATVRVRVQHDNSRAADDFISTLATPCPAISIDVPGAYLNGTGPAPIVQVRFFHDRSGKPGAVYRTRNVPATAPGFTDTLGTFHIPWTKPVVLQPSTIYWVSVSVRMNFSPGGEWGWETLSPQSGNAAVWKNPGGGMGVGCRVWQPLATCFGSSSAADLMFTIND